MIAYDAVTGGGGEEDMRGHLCACEGPWPETSLGTAWNSTEPFC